MTERGADETKQQLRLVGRRVIGVAIVAVVIAYPPSVIGLQPPLGLASIFLAGLSLLIALIGGIILARGKTDPKNDRTHRVMVRALVPAVSVAMIGLYLVSVAGLGSSLAVEATAVGFAIGILDVMMSSV
ncbi:hypothetical protein ACFR9U_14085 [Halorientalis brevis]|uniref:Integral membrane protein n=1 Tax=Halorientalis brevis TaxID=1126241 RepID=A0ABD6CFI8_9EURY|nr:hypothetical protein [Halorientalis brevis]